MQGCKKPVTVFNDTTKKSRIPKYLNKDYSTYYIEFKVSGFVMQFLSGSLYPDSP